MGQVQKILRLLNYPYFLDEVVAGDAWRALAVEYQRMTGRNVDSLAGYFETIEYIDHVHQSITKSSMPDRIGQTEMQPDV